MCRKQSAGNLSQRSVWAGSEGLESVRWSGLITESCIPETGAGVSLRRPGSLAPGQPTLLGMGGAPAANSGPLPLSCPTASPGPRSSWCWPRAAEPQVLRGGLRRVRLGNTVAAMESKGLGACGQSRQGTGNKSSLAQSRRVHQGLPLQAVPAPGFKWEPPRCLIWLYLLVLKCLWLHSEWGGHWWAMGCPVCAALVEGGLLSLVLMQPHRRMIGCEWGGVTRLAGGVLCLLCRVGVGACDCQPHHEDLERGGLPRWLGGLGSLHQASLGC